MFSSWDLVRPRFWYPMSSLEQSMMELEQMSDVMALRPRFPFGAQREMPMMTTYVGDKGDSDSDSDADDDDFFVDLPVVARKCMPAAFQLQVIPEAIPEEGEEASMGVTSHKSTAAANDKSDADASTDMEVDDEGADKPKGVQGDTNSKSKAEAIAATNGNKVKKSKRRNKNKKRDKKQLRKHSYKVTPTSERKNTPNKPDANCRTFSSYSFSNSSVVDDKGRRVTTTRRRYEDSTGRLKAVHEREIDGKKLRTTWSRQSKQDEGRHESICSSGSPEEFETLWQQTPFGEAQKKTVKGQLQSKSDVEKEVETTTAALEDTSMEDAAAKETVVKETEKASNAKEKNKAQKEENTEEEK
ncbi:hypothetical protein PR003_g5475 [Phytophthora rubi]|uniref:Uncharacterized protein n=1 Tax=Phytophthora rubi TaxID=129364 RepID=A0A6A4FSA3_9STRA|nr:hypothetical protein PR001_g1941 [Phytophthora rubi]KAE9350197.1 hypothetical protein PR003_g5475 [Phytophthora rubi]